MIGGLSPFKRGRSDRRPTNERNRRQRVSGRAKAIGSPSDNKVWTPWGRGSAASQPTSLAGTLSEDTRDSAITDELWDYLQDNPSIKNTVTHSIDEIRSETEAAEVYAYSESGFGEPEPVRAMIEVRAEISDIEEYRGLRDRVSDIVRDIENSEDPMVYTLVEQK